MSATAIAPERKLFTPEDLLRLPDGGAGYELLDGRLKETSVGTESSRIGGEIYYALRAYIRETDAGWAFPADTPFRCFADAPGRVRKPDAAYISLARMPLETYVDEGYCTVVPDLVAEVVSPTDFFTDVAVKRDQWLSAGVRTVWVVEPETRTIYAHRPDGVAFLRSTDTLTADGILPGFAVPIADLFRKPGEGVGK